MKKRILITVGCVVLIALIAILLIGLFGDKNAATPLEAYQANPDFVLSLNATLDQVDAEIGFVKITETYGVWLAIVNGDRVIAKPMTIENNTYRTAKDSSFYMFTLFENAKPRTEPLEIRYDTYSLCDSEEVCFKLLPTVHIPNEHRTKDVNYQDFTVTYQEFTFTITAAYYIQSK